MIIETYPLEPIATNAIFIGCEKTKKAAAIDPAMGSTEIFLSWQDKGYKIENIFLTHSHWDHVVDVAKLKNELNCPVFVHKLDANNLKAPGSDGLPMFFPIEAVDTNEFFEEGKKYYIGLSFFEVIHTPGHSPGSVCFYFKEENLLISGDTLFKGSMGNVSFPTSSKEQICESLKKLAKLPSETIVVPGHGEKTTIRQESWLDSAEKFFNL